MDPKIKKPDYGPPGWLVTHWHDAVRLDTARAQRLHDFRIRLCEALGADNDLCNPTNLFRMAVDMLIAKEAAILSSTDGKPFEFDGMVKQKEEK
jgi:hypothetical protein